MICKISPITPLLSLNEISADSHIERNRQYVPFNPDLYELK